MMRLLDRIQAGKLLAENLVKYADNPKVLVLGLPRGGVPVAYQVAKKLHAKLDVMIVRKLGVPGHEELAMGAIALGDVAVFNPDVVRSLSLPDDDIKSVIDHERQELKRRNQKYRASRKPPAMANQIIILIDDGIATGATMHAAIKAIRKMQPAKIIVAVPVAPLSVYEEFKNEVDELICLITPEPYYGVGMWYENFEQTTDAEVCQLLEKALTLN